MFSPRMRNALAAIAVCIPFNASSHNQINTPPQPRTTPNLSFRPLELQGPSVSRSSCPMQVVSYFDEPTLRQINYDLGQIKNWMRENGAYDHSLMHEFLDEGMSLDSEERLAKQRFEGLYRLDGIYDAGWEKGYDYLKQNPFNTLRALFAYVEHMKVLTMIRPDLEESLQTSFGGSLNLMTIMINNTHSLMESQLQDGCDVPAIPPLPPTQPKIAR